MSSAGQESVWAHHGGTSRRPQIQLPEELYREAKRVARERELSLAEVVRRGVEYITRVYPPARIPPDEWRPPEPRALGAFRAPVRDWRLLANEPPADDR